MLRIISWNIAALHKYINWYNDPRNRISVIIESILQENADIVCLQEVFDYGIQKYIVDRMEEAGYHIHFSTDKSYVLPKNGLMTLTRLQIQDRIEVDYNKSIGMEKWINKGILTTRIRTSLLGTIYIHNTHTQSDTRFWPRYFSQRCRNYQFSILKQHIANLDNCFDAQFVAGDMNDNFTVISAIFNTFNNNTESITTFPKSKKQLDYIMANDRNLVMRHSVKECIANETSDHHMLICEVDIPS